jgi:hypothetical protein
LTARQVVDVEDAADPRRELGAHASRARVGLIPADNAAAEDAEDVLIAEIAVARGNLRTVYVIGVDRGAGMTGRSHQGAPQEQRDNEGGTQGANLEFDIAFSKGLVSSSCEALRSPAAIVSRRVSLFWRDHRAGLGLAKHVSQQH